jgi:hypothetical protein
MVDTSCGWSVVLWVIYLLSGCRRALFRPGFHFVAVSGKHNTIVAGGKRNYSLE